MYGSFPDSTFDQLAHSYIYACKLQLAGTESYRNEELFSSLWNNGSNARASLIVELYEKYGLPLSSSVVDNYRSDSISITGNASSQSVQNSFETYNIVSFSVVPNSKEFSIIKEYTIDWTIQNNSSAILSDFAATICFYDKNGSIIESDSRGIQFSLEPGQSTAMKFYCDNDFASCRVTNYQYHPSKEFPL